MKTFTLKNILQDKQSIPAFAFICFVNFSVTAVNIESFVTFSNNWFHYWKCLQTKDVNDITEEEIN